MKRTIELSKWHVAALGFFVFGVFSLISGIAMTIAINMSKMDPESLRRGKYIKGEITQYMGKDSEINTSFYGVSSSVAYGFRFYDVYTIPISGGQYVELLVRDPALQDILESYDRGVGRGAYFVGKVEKRKYRINDDFWTIDGIKDNIYDKYVIRQVNPKKATYKLCVGVSMLVTSWMIFMACGGVKRILI
ncbi:MAG: hypothetical protein K2O40_10750 [Lachnospiraceae bacterium]|nr:hypothetical protein [Lachnospiraceae bacterium]